MIATPGSTGAYIAVVRGPDGVRFSTAATSDGEIVARLVTYVVERCDDVLWPADAADVRRLIDERRELDAVAAYFATVGQRWDEEWLDRRPAW